MKPKRIKKDDNLRAWLAPILKESLEQGMDTSSEFLQASQPPHGQLYGPFDYLLFGQLLIKRLGWEGNYPSEPSDSHRVELTKSIDNALPTHN